MSCLNARHWALARAIMDELRATDTLPSRFTLIIILMPLEIVIASLKVEGSEQCVVRMCSDARRLTNDLGQLGHWNLFPSPFLAF
jgi:hypothetical protein